MTAVRITTKPGGGSVCVVDGVDVSMQILAEGFWVEFPEDFTAPVRVHMIVAADQIEMDLPEAVIQALQQEQATDEVDES